MKHTITIQLVSQPQTFVTAEGPDYWQITLTTVTSEGQTQRSKHCSMDKAKALQEAYALIIKQRICEWFPAFYTEEAVKYADILVHIEGVADRFNESMDLVQQGKRTKEEHLTLWASRMDLLESTRFMLPLSPNREHVLTGTTLPQFADCLSLRERIKLATAMVEKGTITKYQFNKWMKNQLNGECPMPQRWKWYHWFWNPEGAKK